jgi:hypothetical protein
MNKGLFVLAALLLVGSVAANSMPALMGLRFQKADCIWETAEDLEDLGNDVGFEWDEGDVDELFGQMDEAAGGMRDCAEAHDITCFNSAFADFVSAFNELRVMWLYYAMDEVRDDCCEGNDCDPECYAAFMGELMFAYLDEQQDMMGCFSEIFR